MAQADFAMHIAAVLLPVATSQWLLGMLQPFTSRVYLYDMQAVHARHQGF